MRYATIFAIFAGAMFIALLALWLMLALLGLEATVIILLASSAFGAGAAAVEYLTTERS